MRERCPRREFRWQAPGKRAPLGFLGGRWDSAREPWHRRYDWHVGGTGRRWKDDFDIGDGACANAGVYLDVAGDDCRRYVQQALRAERLGSKIAGQGSSGGGDMGLEQTLPADRALRRDASIAGLNCGIEVDALVTGEASGDRGVNTCLDAAHIGPNARVEDVRAVLGARLDLDDIAEARVIKDRIDGVDDTTGDAGNDAAQTTVEETTIRVGMRCGHQACCEADGC